MTDYLVACIFNPQSFFYKKIQNIKERQGLIKSAFEIYLPLFAPFKLRKKIDKEASFLELEETFQSFYPGTHGPKIKFENLEIYKAKRRYLVYLDTSMDEDWPYCLEKIMEIKKEYFVSLKSKEAKKPYIVLGKYQNEFEAVEYRNYLNEEFSFPFSEPVSEIAIFEKQETSWRLGQNVVKFIT